MKSGSTGGRAAADAQRTVAQKVPQPKRIPAAIPALLLAAFFTLTGLVSWYYTAEKARLREEAVEQLSSIGLLKAEEITAWRAERLADAAVLTEGPFLSEQVGQFLSDPAETRAAPLLQRFRSLQNHYGYSEIFLATPGGDCRLSLGGTRPQQAPHLLPVLETVLRTRRPALTDLHAEAAVGTPHLGVVAPVFEDWRTPGSPVIAAIVLVCDATQYLYPLLHAWPVPSRSAESLLASRDGDAMLFLSELRDQAGSALKLRIPLARTDAPVVQAALGRRGIVEGPDYRGVRVLSYVTQVPGSPWLLVVKKDQAEIFAEWQRRSRAILFAFAALILGLAAFALLAWHSTNHRHFKQLYHVEARLRAAAEELGITLRSIGDAVIAADLQGRVTLLNPVAEALTGWTDAEARGRPLEEVFRIVNEETRTTVESPVTKVLREGKVVGLANHTLLLARDGAERPIADSAAPVRDLQDDRTRGVVMVFRDQTLERSYSALFQRMLNGFATHAMLYDADGRPVNYRFLDANPAFELMTGLKVRAIVGKTVREVLPDLEGRWIETYARVVATGVPETFENYSRALDRHYRVTAFRNGPRQFATIFEDVSEQVRQERELRESENKYRSLTDDVLDNSEVGVFILDATFHVVWINHAQERFFGLQRAQVVGRDKRELIRAPIAGIFEDPSQFQKRVFATYDDNSYTEKFECHVLAGQGRTERWLQHWSQPIRSGLYAGGRIEQYYDITEQVLAEVEHKRLLSAIEQSGEMVVITDPQGTIQYVNHAFEVVTGYTRQEALGRNPRILKSGRQDAAFYRAFWKRLADGRGFSGRMVNRAKDGSLFTEDASVSPVWDAQGKLINYVSVKRDVTDRLLMEEQLHQAQKMESVGRLAGGVAHDFNNMLSVIMGNAEMALESLSETDPLHADLTEIVRAAKRSGEITQQLLAFARKQIVAPRILDLNRAVEDMLKMLRRLIGENIELCWMPDPAQCRIEIDPAQLNQILANLCVNARDAIADVGTITIQTAREEVDEAFCERHPNARSGRFVKLTVRDTGTGMDSATLAHLFEPFFTTKALGQGTGLGLATVFGIVDQNQGFILVESAVGQGSTFSIFLPCRSAEPLSAPQAAEVAPAAGHGETVLVVEDEEVLLAVTSTMLEKLGYRVLRAIGAQEALRRVEEQAGPIDLLLADVIMPGMNGRELAQRLQKLRPGLRCLYMSGYTANAIAHHGVLDGDVHFIQKPFTLQVLAQKILHVLTAG